MRRVVAFMIVSVVTVIGLVVPAAAGPSGPFCGIRWGSLDKAAEELTYTSRTIDNLRAGRHRCFDRLVLDLGPSALGLQESAFGFQARYGTAPIDSETGGRLDIHGGAYLGLIVHAPAHDADYRPTVAPADRLNAVGVSGFKTFRQVAFLGTFEGQTELVIAVRGRLPYRVFILEGPGSGSRMVVDVAHRW